MDICYEYMIKKKKAAWDYIKVIGGGILAVILTVLLILLFFAGLDVFGLNFLLIFLTWWGFVILLKNFNVEYEYTITNHELDIDMIKGKNKRKHITTINLKRCDYFGNKNDPAVIEAMKASGKPAKEYYFVADKASENIFVTDVISRKDNSKIRVYTEPNKELAEYIRLANPKAYKGSYIDKE